MSRIESANPFAPLGEDGSEAMAPSYANKVAAANKSKAPSQAARAAQHAAKEAAAVPVTQQAQPSIPRPASAATGAPDNDVTMTEPNAAKTTTIKIPASTKAKKTPTTAAASTPATQSTPDPFPPLPQPGSQGPRALSGQMEVDPPSTKEAAPPAKQKTVMEAAADIRANKRRREEGDQGRDQEPANPPNPQPPRQQTRTGTNAEAPPAAPPAPHQGVPDMFQASFARPPNDDLPVNLRPANPIAHTPKPMAGFPRVHFTSPYALKDNIAEATYLEWITTPQPQGMTLIFGHIFGQGCPFPRNAAQVAAKAKEILGRIVACEDMLITAPSPAKVNGHQRVNDPPYSFPIFNLSTEAATHLLDLGVVCTAELTIAVYRPVPAIPRFLFALVGFTVDAQKLHLIREHVMRVMTSNGAIHQANKLAYPNREQTYDFDAIKKVERIFGTLEITIVENKVRGGGVAPVFNVYMDSPTDDPAKWCSDWQKFLRNLNYSSVWYGGRVELHEGWRCSMAGLAATVKPPDEVKDLVTRLALPDSRLNTPPSTTWPVEAVGEAGAAEDEDVVVLGDEAAENTDIKSADTNSAKTLN
ncbi:hypothetical protein EUX98_g8830 [Antrodiella citrinella]|uniref:Uncharacterized protein n=1 Tax=Antrodiella citrinella TaxID=2447956 RepID=A0A4S4M3N1_9APHY|nr:hypothetical protein EUX98_g8830 [Antrodiella citrinella]